MDKKEFDELVAKGFTNLTDEERKKVAQFILDNEEERDICLRGAFINNDMRLVTSLMFGKPTIG